MDRRRFLQFGMTGVAVAALPGTLRAQSQQPGPPTPGVEQATVAAPAPAPDIAHEISPMARGKTLMVVNKLALTVGFYDAVSGAQQKLISLPSRPHELLVARDGLMAYVSIYGDGIYGANPHPGNQVAVIDLTRRECVGFLSTGGTWAPHGLAEAPDGTIWASCDIGASVVGFDPKTSEHVATVPVGHKGGHWIVAHPTSGFAYLSNRSGPGIAVVDLLKRKPAGMIETPHAITGLALSPDGARLFAMDDQRPALVVIDTAAGKVLSIVPIAGLPCSTAAHGDRERRVATTLDGRFVLVADFPSAALVRIDAARPHRQQLLLVQHGPMGVAASRDGQTAWVCNHDAGTITVVDVPTMRALRDFGVGQGPETAAILS